MSALAICSFTSTSSTLDAILKDEFLSLDRFALSEFVFVETVEITLDDEPVIEPPYGSTMVKLPTVSTGIELPAIALIR